MRVLVPQFHFCSNVRRLALADRITRGQQFGSMATRYVTSEVSTAQAEALRAMSDLVYQLLELPWE
jgi:hypothetical protein